MKQEIELLHSFSLTDFKSRHRGSALGFLWLLLTPCFLLLIYTFVFGIVFERSFDKPNSHSIFDYAIGLFIGISIFQIFSNSIATTPHSIIGKPNFIKKIKFPLHILPISTVISGSVVALINLGLSTLISIISFNSVGFRILYIVPVMLTSIFFASSIGLLLSAISVYLRDVVQMSSFLNLALMFSSGIFYLPEEIPPSYYTFLKFNPIIHLVDIARKIILWNEQFSYLLLFILSILSVLCLFISYRIFLYMKSSFSDAI
jgi:lipopolysaccharide transport system permease protein